MSAPSPEFVRGYNIAILHALQHVAAGGDAGSHLYIDLIKEVGFDEMLALAKQEGAMEWSGMADYMQMFKFHPEVTP